MKAQKCPYCEKVFKSGRGIPGHVKICHPEKQGSEQQQEQHDCKDHLKMLRRSNMVHMQFISQGYTSYCEICEEVY